MIISSSASIIKLFLLSTMVLVILNMHEVVRITYLVKKQQPNAVWWWKVLQMRFLIPDCLDLVVVLMPLCVGPRVSFIVYDMFKLGMLFRLGIEGVRLTRKEMIIDKRCELEWSSTA